MAKDPAFLFYPGDWQGGTMTMSRHIKGCYIDLLVAQFNSGPLSLEEIKIVLGNDFAAWQGSLSKKFKQTETGLFFNERLEAEKTKRVEFSNKQKDRISKRWNKNGMQSGNTVVLPIENENRNEDVNVIGKGVQGENQILLQPGEGGRRPDEVDFTDYELWTQSIIDHTDPMFEQMLMGEKLKPNGSLEKMAKGHLELLARYSKTMRPQSQQTFRYSALKYIKETLEKPTTKNQQLNGKHTNIVLNR